MTAASVLVEEPRLVEVARELVVPEGIVSSVFPRVEARLAEAGITFDPWEQDWMTPALGVRADGRYAATVGGNTASIPRQVGKTFTVRAVMIGLCLEFPGLVVIWTSHHNRTTTKTFRAFKSIVKRPNIYCLLLKSSHSDGIRESNGEQEIRFKNGSIIMFGARAEGLARGIDEVDIEVFDEAQILSLKALEDMVPATNQARHVHGGLLFFLGTPPRPTDDGEAFTAKRDKALSGLSRDMMYVEMSGDPADDRTDASRYHTFNPSFPLRTPLEAIERMRENIPDDDSFDREARGIWSKVPSPNMPVIPAERWRAMFDIGPADGVKPDALGVDMSHAREISVGACWVDGELAHVEEVWAGVDVAAAADWITARIGRRIDAVIDSLSPAACLVPELRARGVQVRLLAGTGTEMSQACGGFESRVDSDTLTHAGQQRLSEAVAGARKRPIRDAGGWGWDRRNPSSKIHPLVAVTLALFGASKKRRTSSRTSSGRVGVAL